MAKKYDYSLFANFFFNSLKILDYSLIFSASIFTIHYFLAHYSLFIIKKGHYSLIIIPHPDPLLRAVVLMLVTITGTRSSSADLKSQVLGLILEDLTFSNSY